MPIILDGTTGITTPGITNTGTFVFQGPVQVPAGSAATASITTAAGANTGIFFPSSSSVAITTAGTQRFVVSASGDVGIGTATPATKLAINGAVQILGGSALNFQNATASANGTINGSGGSGDNSLSFNSGALLLNASGNLGLGVTPGVPFEVKKDGVLATGNWYNIAKIYDSSGNKGLQLGYDNTSQTTILAASTSSAASKMAFYTYSGSAWSQAMTLDASGNLGLGTTSPSDSGGYGRVLDIQSATGAQVILRDSDDTSKYVRYAFEGGSVNAASLIGVGTGVYLALGTGNTERARITSGGDMVVGGTTSHGRLTVQNSSPGVGLALSTPSAVRQIFWIPDGYYGYQCAQVIYADGGKAFIFANAAGTEVGTIVVNNASTAYNTTSDYRLKDEHKPLTGSGAFIDAIKPKEWVWKTNGERGVGFIAHELADVSPSSVSGEKDGMRLDKVKDENGEYVEKMIPNYQSVSYSSGELIANLVAEVQSLRARLAAAGI